MPGRRPPDEAGGDADRYQPRRGGRHTCRDPCTGITATRQRGSLGRDACEEAGDLCFRDLSAEVIHDDTFAPLLTLPNVLVTGHQAFLTADALSAIAEGTMASLDTVEAEGRALHAVSVEHLA